MAKITNQAKDNPRLEQRTLKDGRVSLYLEYYLGRTETPVLDEQGNQVLYTTGAMAGKPKYKVTHLRKKETLPYYLTAHPKNALEKQQNKQIFELAKKIRFEKEQELIENKNGFRLQKEQKINFFDFYQSYLDNYTKKDKRMVQIAFNRLKDFFKDTPEYNVFMKSIRPEQITKDMIKAFVEYLQSRSYGEGAKSIYQRFKKVIHYAVEHDIMAKNPCEGISIKCDDKVLTKDVLSPDEITKLISTHYKTENPVVRRAFILCLYCGLRWCDVRDLTFKNVDYSNKTLSFEQNKTKGHSSASGVVIPLTDELLELIGKPTDPDNLETLIFPLPSYESACKSVKVWVRRAGINKHISWHCARHSFATNILDAGANIKTVASLLGHSGLRYTEKYTRVVDSRKREAISSLPKLKLE